MEPFDMDSEYWINDIKNSVAEGVKEWVSEIETHKNNVKHLTQHHAQILCALDNAFAYQLIPEYIRGILAYERVLKAVGSYDVAIDYLKRAADLAREQQLDHELAKVLNQHAQHLHLLDEDELAGSLLQEALNLGIMINKPLTLMETLIALSNLLHSRGKLEAARNYASFAKQIADSCKEDIAQEDIARKALTAILATIGNIEISLGNHNAAYACMKDAFSLVYEGEPNYVVIAVNVGVTAFNLQRYEEAKHYLSLVIQIAELNQNLHPLTFAYSRLGATLEQMGFYEESLLQYKNARNLVGNLGDTKLSLDIAINLSNLLAKSGEFDEALTVIQDALNIFKQQDHKGQEESALLANLASVYFFQEDYQRAYDAAIQGLLSTETNESWNNRMVLLISLGAICTELKRYDDALEYFNRCETVFREPENWLYPVLLHNKAGLFFAQNNYGDALELLSIAEQKVIMKDIRAMIYFDKARILFQLEEFALAKQLANESLTILHKLKHHFSIKVENWLRLISDN